MSMEKEVYKAFVAIPREFHERGNDCMYQLQEAAKAFDAFAAEVTTETEERRAQDHEEAVLACRKQSDLIDEIQKELWPAEDRATAAFEAAKASVFQLRAAVESRPTRYPLKEEIAAWEQAVQDAREAVEQAEQESHAVSSGPIAVKVRLEAAKARLAELDANEFKLRPQQEQEKLMRRGITPMNASLGLMGEGKQLPILR